MTVVERALAARSAWIDLPIEEIRSGGRRLDGEAYLLGGHVLRRRIEALGAYAELPDLAACWMPGRLKGINVAPDHGLPYLAATQVFDIRPVPRRWLAIPKVKDLKERVVERGWILMTRSGSVGDVLLTFGPHDKAIVSDDLLRVVPHSAADLGWLYAFLRSGYGRTMLRSSRYGSTVKHLQPQHLHDVPVPDAGVALKKELAEAVTEAFELRGGAYRELLDAEAIYETALGGPVSALDQHTFDVDSTEIRRRRRRIDAYHYNTRVRDIEYRLEQHAADVVTLDAVASRVFGVARFKHVYASDGIPYLDSEDLYKLNPELTKFIPPLTKKNIGAYLVERGWILMACSGQLYGLNGTVVLANEWHEGKIVSNHVVRIVPRESIRPGYLTMALGHPTLGRPLVTCNAFGSEVPEIAPEDLVNVRLPRLPAETEDEVADRVERADRMRHAADQLEDRSVEIVEEALTAELGPAPTVV